MGGVPLAAAEGDRPCVPRRAVEGAVSFGLRSFTWQRQPLQQVVQANGPSGRNNCDVGSGRAWTVNSHARLVVLQIGTLAPDSQ